MYNYILFISCFFFVPCPVSMWQNITLYLPRVRRSLYPLIIPDIIPRKNIAGTNEENNSRFVPFPRVLRPSFAFTRYCRIKKYTEAKNAALL